MLRPMHIEEDFVMGDEDGIDILGEERLSESRTHFNNIIHPLSISKTNVAFTTIMPFAEYCRRSIRGSNEDNNVDL